MMVITQYKGCSLENQSRYLYNEQIAIKLQCKWLHWIIYGHTLDNFCIGVSRELRLVITRSEVVHVVAEKHVRIPRKIKKKIKQNLFD